MGGIDADAGPDELERAEWHDGRRKGMVAMNLTLPDALVRELPKVVGRLGLGGIEPIRRLVSRAVINKFGYATTLRPRALSLASDYTSWLSLTDRTFSGRHLPPSTAAQQAALPPEAEVVALYRREHLTPATDTSVMCWMAGEEGA